ncbi:metallophosphoesterase [Arboricoccus pini]|uniref:metallophosphoesterase n=1 Tax=Arboricoccus pini TaxID=1963835 RepID=UPI0013FD78D1|nr:metallophosphoesterase [Arboricoccus pini]
MVEASVVKDVCNAVIQWFRAEPERVPSVDGRPATLPPGRRVYAVGDIHGRYDLLLEIERLIQSDLRDHPPEGFVDLVYLGDFIDRGPASRQVIEHMVHHPLQGVTTHYLLGNHDAWFRELLVEPGPEAEWWRYGGRETAASYEMQGELPPPGPEREAWRTRLRRRVPASHRRFLNELCTSWRLGDYFFCHAGVRPGVALDLQGQNDLIWIRRGFLEHEGDLGAVVVHGHTIVERPVVKANRIGIDTGAFRSDRLTGLVLEGAAQRFLVTGWA